MRARPRLPHGADERRRLRNLETEVTRNPLGQFQHRAVFRHQPVGLCGVREFEEFLVVAVFAFRQRPGIFRGCSGFDQLREACNDGKRRRLVHIAMHELRVVEHVGEFGEAARVDQRGERATFERGADRPRVRIVEHENIDPYIGIEDDAQSAV